jgi:hypothetical protein
MSIAGGYILGPALRVLLLVALAVTPAAPAAAAAAPAAAPAAPAAPAAAASSSCSLRRRAGLAADTGSRKKQILYYTP